jgi:endogenous inhibitor of DNA gyrase (YacG/DUF329 family)
MIRRQSCPVCGKQPSESTSASRSLIPFCSDRCKSIDLLRWSEGRYAIVEQLTPDEAELLQYDPDITVVDERDGE